jgi:hypothetical protein
MTDNNNIKLFNATTQKWDNTNILTEKTIIDNTVEIVNETNQTKKLKFDASGITPSTTRVQKIADQNGTIVATNITNRILINVTSKLKYSLIPLHTPLIILL